MSPHLAILLAAVCFGTTGTAQALGPDSSPLAVGAGRIVLGGALLAAFAWSARGPWPWKVSLASAAGVAVYQLTFFAAVDRTGVAIGTVVALGSAPVWTGLLAWLDDRTPMTRRWAACTALATAGVTLLVLGGGTASVDPLGVGLALISGTSYATYTVLSKRLLRAGHAPETVMARSFGLAGALLVPVLLLSGPGDLAGAAGAAEIIYLAVVPTALAYVLFARGLRRVAPGEAATLTLAEPLTAAALGVAVLGERPGLVALAGAALVLAGLVALAAPRRPAAALPAAAPA